MTPHEVRTIAVFAQCDPRTVRRYLAGEKCRGSVVDRIKAAVMMLDAEEGSR